MADGTSRLWHRLHGEECASAIRGLANDLERTQGPRRQRIRRNISTYEMRALDGLNPASYFTNVELGHEDWDVMRVPLGRGLVNTAVAKIAGKQKPKTQCVVNDGDWGVKRKAKKMERFAEAHMLARHGSCSDAWEQGIRATRDCCVADIGAVKWETNVQAKRIDIFRVLPWQLLVDPLDAQNGNPQTLLHVYAYDQLKAAERFPKHEAAIMLAPDLSAESMVADYYGETNQQTKMVLVREAWRLPTSDKKGGRHAICIGSAELTDHEEWTEEFFPFEFFVWEEWMQGIYGTSVIDNVYHLVGELNAAAQRMSDAERFGSNQMIFAEEGTVVREGLESNIAKTIVEYQKGAQPPVPVTPDAISQSSVNWFQTLKALGYEIPGISQMSATGQKEPGVTANSALRTIESIATERFSIAWQMYERRMSVGAFRQTMRCAREIAKEVKDYSVKWPGAHGFLQEFKLEDIDLPEDQYQIQPYSVSGLINTPADRLDLASELMDRQIISPEGYLRVIQAKDIDEELSRTNTWAQLIEKYIESWLDATKESEEQGLAGDPKAFRYRPPVKFMPLGEAILQVGRAYADAELQGAPDYNLQFFIRFMKDADRAIQDIEAQKAKLAAVATGATGGAMPGAPPPDAGPPMMPPAGPPPGAVVQ